MKSNNIESSKQNKNEVFIVARTRKASPESQRMFSRRLATAITAVNARTYATAKGPVRFDRWFAALFRKKEKKKKKKKKSFSFLLTFFCTVSNRAESRRSWCGRWHWSAIVDVVENVAECRPARAL
jgi:predicted protein tyrosine phosphatase